MKASKYVQILVKSIQENGGDYEMEWLTSEELHKNRYLRFGDISQRMFEEACEQVVAEGMDDLVKEMCPEEYARKKKISLDGLIDTMHEAQEEVNKAYLSGNPMGK